VSLRALRAPRDVAYCISVLLMHYYCLLYY
jgi:hypothetical protein